MTLDFSGWVSAGQAADRIGTSRQNIDSMIRRGLLGKRGEGWVMTPVYGRSGRGSYLVSPEGVSLGRAYWKRSPFNPKNRKPKV